MSDNDRPRHDKNIEAISKPKNSARLMAPIPHSRDRCIQNLAILIGGRMEYLTRDGSKVYHLMRGNNTYCKGWQRGGMNQTKKTWHVVNDRPDKQLCTMCNNVRNKGGV